NPLRGKVFGTSALPVSFGGSLCVRHTSLLIFRGHRIWILPWSTKSSFNPRSLGCVSMGPSSFDWNAQFQTALPTATVVPHSRPLRLRLLAGNSGTGHREAGLRRPSNSPQHYL